MSLRTDDTRGRDRGPAVRGARFARLAALGIAGWLAACSGASTGASTTPARQPSRAELVASGCAPTWEEALTRIGPLASWEVPRTRGYSLAQLDPPPPPEPALPEVCHYPEGDCEAVRYESACVVHTDYQCHERGQDVTEVATMPCDRPPLP